MPNSRMGRTLSGLAIGTLLLGGSACATVQDLIPIGGGQDWSAKKFAKGFGAITEEAGTDQVVEAAAITGAVTATLLTDAGEPAYYMWDFEDQEVVGTTNPDEEVGFAAPDRTAASAVSLSTLDLEAVVERDGCERDSYTFNYRAVGLDGAHSYLYTECADTGESTTAEFHEYIDDEPVKDPDLTAPAAVAELTETATEYAAHPPELAAVGLGISTETGGMEFSYSASSTIGTNLEGHPCQPHFSRTTEMKAGRSGSLLTACRNPEDSDLGELPPYDASAFDPAVLVELWNSEVGQRWHDRDFPTVTFRRNLDGELVYFVTVDDETSEFDPVGNPLN